MHLHSQTVLHLTSYNEYWRFVRSCWFAEAHQGLDQQQHNHGQASATRAARPVDHFNSANTVVGPSLLNVPASSTRARGGFGSSLCPGRFCGSDVTSSQHVLRNCRPEASSLIRWVVNLLGIGARFSGCCPCFKHSLSAYIKSKP
jgi:hypothetical protein